MFFLVSCCTASTYFVMLRKQPTKHRKTSHNYTQRVHTMSFSPDTSTSSSDECSEILKFWNFALKILRVLLHTNPSTRRSSNARPLVLQLLMVSGSLWGDIIKIFLKLATSTSWRLAIIWRLWNWRENWQWQGRIFSLTPLLWTFSYIRWAYRGKRKF